LCTLKYKNIFAGTDTVGVHASYGIWMFCIFATFPGIYAIIAAALADYFGQKHYQAQPFQSNQNILYWNLIVIMHYAFIFCFSTLIWNIMFFLSLKKHHEFCYICTFLMFKHTINIFLLKVLHFEQEMLISLINFWLCLGKLWSTVYSKPRILRNNSYHHQGEK